MSHRQHFLAVAALTVAVGVLGLSRAVFAGRSGGAPVVVLRLVNKGQVRLAHREITKMLARNPSDPELHAAYGAVLSTAALYPDAVLAFEDALGSDWYESRGFRYHAKALARTGRGDEAAALRESFTVVRGDDEAILSVTMYSRMIEDQLEGGTVEEALRLGEEMVLAHPDRAYSWGYLAWAQVHAGLQDEAAWSLQQAERYAGKTLRIVQMAQSYWMLEEQRYTRADHELQSQWQEGFKDPELWWLRLEIMRRSGYPETCVQRAELSRFEYQEEPAFTAAYARCLDGVGRGDEARVLLRSALETHPGSNRLLAAGAELGVSLPESPPSESPLPE